MLAFTKCAQKGYLSFEYLVVETVQVAGVRVLAHSVDKLG